MTTEPETSGTSIDGTTNVIADGVDLSELMVNLPPARDTPTVPVAADAVAVSSSSAPPPLMFRSFTSEDRKRIQFAEHVTESQKVNSLESTGGSSGGGVGGPISASSTGSALNNLNMTTTTTNTSGSGLSLSRRPSSTRRKKSIRITLDDDRDTKSEAGSISSMIERNKLRFEDSPTTPLTPLRSKGSVASNDTSLFDDKLRLLSISDASTGICLYKCTWNWRRNTNVDGVGSLVQSFYQFAREIGDGGLAYISFELPASRSHHRHTPRKRQQSQRSQASMSVLTTKGPTCVVALFFDDRQLKPTDVETEKSLRAYMEAVKEEFVLTYKSKVESLRPTLRDIADGKNQVLEVTDIQKSFETFEPVVLRLREKLLPDSSQPHSNVHI